MRHTVPENQVALLVSCSLVAAAVERRALCRNKPVPEQEHALCLVGHCWLQCLLLSICSSDGVSGECVIMRL
jgi:hypothetical protein